ncbi:MAG: lectin like domain-containing protein [Candidatus Limivivens sp.]|nr:lectin like domain-containing protein [Candidatus Limivivens sp.]
MIRKLERVLTVLIVVLTGYLFYGMYQPQIHKLTAELRKSVRQTEAKEEFQQEEDPAEDLPPVYDCRENGKAPAVKNQGNLGTCWALAATSALEANLRPGEIWNFSADHMSMQNGYEKNQNDGGAYTMAMAYLASWTGPVREEDDVYGDGYSPEGLSAVKHVQEMHMIKDGSLEEIKEEIYRWGAVQASVYVDDQRSLENSVYYSQLNNSYCYVGNEPANHDILIIGWNDFYSAANFTYNVSEDGAFICQNSWGNHFGEDGIFYVSYEDVRIRECCVSYAQIEDADNYGTIYQTDRCGWVGQLGYDLPECYFANVYTPEGDERLEAVGFYATDRDTSYEIYVAEQFTDTSSLVLWESAVSGSFELAGYYTVKLPEPVQLTAGQPFAVIVKITTPGSKYPVAAEYRADENTKNVVIEDGEGYISQGGYVWSRTEEGYGCNVCLKVYTS